MNAQTAELPAPVEVTEALIKRFWSKVDMRDDSECWLWKVGVDRLGYGQFAIDGQTYRAHRVAYWMWNGPWFSPAVKMRHTCDMRSCCNPMHLRPGTQADNMRDRMQREGYRGMARGELHGLAKLKADHVRAIRGAAAYDGVTRDLAARYGVSGAQVSRIRAGRAWRWLE
jgi:hypothetical protein